MKTIELIYPMNVSQERYYKMPRIYRESTAYYYDSFILTNNVKSRDEIELRLKAIKEKHPWLSCAFFMNEEKKGQLRFKLRQNSNGGYEMANELPDIPFYYTDLSYMAEETTLDTVGKPSKKQNAFLEEDYKVRCELRKIIDVPISIHYYYLRSDLAKIVIMATHVMLDGWSMALLIKELTSDEMPVGQDSFFICADKALHLKNDNSDIEYWKERLEGSEKSIFPWENEYGGDRRILELKINGKRFEKLCEYSRREKISKVSIIQYAYGRAMLVLSGKNSVLFDQLISGRNGLPDGADGIIGVFFNVLPCVLSRGESNKEFYEHCKEDRLHGTIASETIWESILGRRLFLPMNKGITSEIFPFSMGDGVIEIHSTLEKMPGNILVSEKNGIRINFCFRDDPSWNEKTEFLVKETESYINKVIGD